MKEHPILFTGEMVRAILDGRKTQTRRVVKPQPPDWSWNMFNPLGKFNVQLPDGKWVRCPYGAPGDCLWVREAWSFLGTDMNRHGRTHFMQDAVVQYAADGLKRTVETKWDNVERWMKRNPGGKPSIHMPRWASRITLEIVNVRVERIQEISYADSLAEGIQSDEMFLTGKTPYRNHFKELWDSINDKRGPKEDPGAYSWDRNPWVWVIKFKRIEEPK